MQIGGVDWVGNSVAGVLEIGTVPFHMSKGCMVAASFAVDLDVPALARERWTADWRTEVHSGIVEHRNCR
jgi:hypothetical protein